MMPRQITRRRKHPRDASTCGSRHHFCLGLSLNVSQFTPWESKRVATQSFNHGLVITSTRPFTRAGRLLQNLAPARDLSGIVQGYGKRSSIRRQQGVQGSQCLSGEYLLVAAEGCPKTSAPLWEDRGEKPSGERRGAGQCGVPFRRNRGLVRYKSKRRYYEKIRLISIILASRVFSWTRLYHA